MSVPVFKRKENRLEVIVKAKELAVYTLNITANVKHFPEEYWNGITSKLVCEANDVFLKCWSANNINANLSDEFYRERKKLQTEAILACNNLLALIELAQKVFKLSSKRVSFWGEKILECRGLIRAWRDSDRKRYDSS